MGRRLDLDPDEDSRSSDADANIYGLPAYSDGDPRIRDLDPHLYARPACGYLYCHASLGFHSYGNPSKHDAYADGHNDANIYINPYPGIRGYCYTHHAGRHTG